jgi:hypothetical protein
MGRAVVMYYTVQLNNSLVKYTLEGVASSIKLAARRISGRQYSYAHGYRNALRLLTLNVASDYSPASPMSTESELSLKDWDNGELVLYHGTDSGSADSIRKGIDLTVCREGRDFGRGFYTTSSFQQAEAWAKEKTTFRRRYSPGIYPVVLSFMADRDHLAGLESLWFVRGTSDDYWSFVKHCRSADETKHGRSDCYDVVAGPVSRSNQFGRSVLADSDQVSFHTRTALEVLKLQS